MVHQVKITKRYAERIISEQKKFEVRYNDRDYQVGDRMRFEVIDDHGSMPGKIISHPLDNLSYKITYVHTGLGMEKHYVILGIEEERKIC